MLDSDGWSDALDEVSVGFLHSFQELAGISREGFYVAALAFCVESIKSQRGFSGTRYSCDNDELILGDIKINILKVVNPDSPECDFIFHEFFSQMLFNLDILL
ncbi:hypothetical protein ES703_66936 [subsurface metagenome]